MRFLLVLVNVLWFANCLSAVRLGDLLELGKSDTILEPVSRTVNHQQNVINPQSQAASITMFRFDPHNILFLVILNIIMQATFAAICYFTKWNKIVDLSGGFSFICLVVVSLVLSQSFLIRQLLATIFVCIWAARLSSYLVYRMVKIGEYDRFEEKRKNLVYFVIFWLFQLVWVQIVALPVVLLNSPASAQQQKRPSLFLLTHDDRSSRNRSSLNLNSGWVVTGCLLFTIGLLLETFADAQKFVYLDDPRNRGKWCDYGFWSFSRHPNYLGEMLVWWGIFCVCVPMNIRSAGVGGLIGTVLGPLYITGILLFLSGLPIMEYKSDRKYGGNSQYVAYKMRTSPLFLIPPRLYARLPDSVKMFVCLELPLYNSLRRSYHTGSRREIDDGTNQQHQYVDSGGQPHRTSLDLMLQAIDDFP